MRGLTVTDITVPPLLDKIQKCEWLVPAFQRGFVWSTSDVVNLVISIFESRPIGMATLWEQANEPEVELVPVSIPTSDPLLRKSPPAQSSSAASLPTRVFAILDGRQRCTAIAMAFGGLRAPDRRSRFAGRYYLNVCSQEPSKRVVFFKEADVQRRKLEIDANCVSAGLFPLSSNLDGEEVLPQWMRYLQALHNPVFYEGGMLPERDELDRRDEILKKCFEGLVGTKFAVYIVPETYHLGAICEIFETLNTTGTKVSTVDLIHSWLYSDTSRDDAKILLRDWIADLGQKDGAIGWASLEDRPELVAQIVTACYVALNTKPPARKVWGDVPPNISSLKADDLLAVPTLHWQNIIRNDDLLAEFLGDFQKAVAGGAFPYSSCPYPITAAIYVGLRWHAHFDAEDRPWGRDDLDALFRAFFWRNALSNRYDQGFLTQLGADIKELKSMLSTRAGHTSARQWSGHIQDGLDRYMEGVLPDHEQMIDLLTDGRQLGALQKALTLPMIGASREDLLDPNIKLSYPTTDVEMHHIYPRAWCRNNKIGEAAELMDKDKAGRDWIESVVNLIPLSRKSNNAWKARIPGQALKEFGITYSEAAATLEAFFIDEKMFNILLAGPQRIKEFWTQRAELMANDLVARTKVVL